MNQFFFTQYVYFCAYIYYIPVQSAPWIFQAHLEANMFNTPVEIHRRYDLKGSWAGNSLGMWMGCGRPVLLEKMGEVKIERETRQ